MCLLLILEGFALTKLKQLILQDKLRMERRKAIKNFFVM